MKKTLFLFFLLCVFLQNGFAQNPDNLKPVVPYSVFPIGAMRGAVADTLSHMYGMNFNWMGFWGGGTTAPFPIHSKLQRLDTSQHIPPLTDPFFWDASNTNKPKFNDTLQDFLIYQAAHCNDIRVWMPGTSGITNEYVYGWNYKKGSLISPSVPEWKIDTVGTNSGDSVLSDLGSAQIDPFTGNGFSSFTPTKWHIYKTYYDFVFFFDSTQLASVGSDSDLLYALDFWVKPADSSTFSKWTTEWITRAEYNALPIANTQATGHTVQADSLFHWFDKPVRQTHNYKVVRRFLNLRNYYHYGDTVTQIISTNTGNFVGDTLVTGVPQVEVRLRSFKKIPIFVRGLRIRDWRAEQLLSGKADDTLKTAISHMLSINGNKNYKSWVIGNENIYKEFHAWSYVNNLLVGMHAPPADILSPPWKDNDLFMRVLRDQTEFGSSQLRGIVWDEESVLNVPWVFRGTNSDILNHLTMARPSSITASRYAAGSRPLPGALTADSANLFKNAVYVLNDHTQFTNESQNNILGYSSEANGGGAGDYQSLLGNARSAYELDPAHPIPYYLMAPTIVTPWSFPKWSVDSLFLTRRDSLFFYIRDSLSKSPALAWAMADTQAGLWGDSVYYTNIMYPYIHPHVGNNLDESALFDVMYANRSPSPAELSYQMWKGVLTGMKGYALNVGYTDFIQQHGFIRDSCFFCTTDSSRPALLKSDEQKNLQVLSYTLQTPYRARYSFFDYPYEYYRWLKLLPGFAQLGINIRSMITQELGPIAPTLAVLQWKGSVSWHKRDSTLTYLSRMPIKNLHSKALTGAIDSTNSSYVQVSVFQHPTDSVAKFIAVQNRLLWCNAANTDTTDYRKISFQVDSTKFGSFSKVTLWKITDVSGQLRDAIVTSRDTFSFTVKPGQGKLFRIAPAIGLTLGGMAMNLFNNARHLAPIENDTAVVKYAATYERSRKIAVSYTSETPTGSSKRTTSNPVDSLIDTSGNAYTPSIAYNKPTNRMGIVYARTLFGTTIPQIDTTSIIFSRTPYSQPYGFNVKQTIAVLIHQHDPNDPFFANPAIVPTNDTANEFWISYRDSTRGGALVIMGKNGNKVNTVYFDAGNPSSTKFISLATHKEFDTVRIAFEEYGSGSTQIYYTQAVFQPANSILLKPVKNVSSSSKSCQHHLPQITTSKRGSTDIVWEATRSSIQGTLTHETHYVMLRARSITNGWTALEVMTPLVDDVPNEEAGAYHLFPNVAASDTLYLDTLAWQASKRVTWNNPVTGRIGLAQLGRIMSDEVLNWETFSLIEDSYEPAMPMLHRLNDVKHPFLYRSPTTNEDGNYQARILQYDFPQTPVTPLKIKLQSVAITKNNLDCNYLLSVAFGGIFVTRDTSSMQIAAASYNPYPNGVDTTSQFGWNDNRFRSEIFSLNTNDTLSYNRYFQIGNFEVGDTAHMANALVDSNDYLKLRINLRRSSDNSLIAVLDSCKLTKNNVFIQTVSGLDTTKLFIAPTSFSEIAYISLEGSRGNDTNSFVIENDEMYDGYIINEIPFFIDSDSYKKGSPITAMPSKGNAGQLKVTIVPNPFHTTAHISVDVPANIPLNITLFDELGRKVTELANGVGMQSHSEFTLTSQTLSTGLYYLRVQSGSEVVTRKVQLLK